MSLSTLRRVSQKSLLARAAILGVAMLVATLLALWTGYALGATKISLAASGLAGAVCLVAGWVAMGLSELFPKPRQVVTLVAVGAIARLGIVLTAAFALYLRGGPLVGAGVLYYLVGFYQVMLAVEIALVLPQGRDSNKPASGQGDRVG